MSGEGNMDAHTKEFWKKKRVAAQETERAERAFFKKESGQTHDITNMIPLPQDDVKPISPDGLNYPEDITTVTRSEARRIAQDDMTKHQVALDELRRLDEEEYKMKEKELEPLSDWFRQQANKKKI